jgi:hypothetical protein
MAVDPSKLKRPSRRSLGAPPTDGSPGIEDEFGLAPDGRNPPAPQPPAVHEKGPDAQVAASRTQTTNAFPPSEPETYSVPQTPLTDHDRQQSSTTGDYPKGESIVDNGAVVTASRVPAPGRGRGDQTGPQGRQRVPLPLAEAKIPFTTRVSLSTKERLEEACHYLRVKHQDFINQAIIDHLSKHGF